MSEKEFAKLLQRYLDGEASEREAQLINDWYDKMISSGETPLSPEDEQKLKNSYDARLLSAVRKSRARVLWPRLAVAASLGAVLLTVGFHFLEPLPRDGEHIRMIAVQSGSVFTAADTQRISLPDGTKVTLHPHSSLHTASDFNSSERKITLSGEAFFEVAHNAEKPFYVYAENVVTKVLGTSFLVRAFPNDQDVKIAVTSGKVSVTDQEKPESDSTRATEVILLPNQQAIYNRKLKMVTHTLVPEPQVVAAAGESVRSMRFENKPVSVIFRTLQTEYGVEIRFDEDRFSKCVLTTSNSGQSLYETIDIICEAIGATYHVEGVRVEISGEGCN